MEYPILIEGRPCGRLTESRDGLYTVFRAECPKQNGLIRLWLHGSGQSVCLGVLSPRGNGLTLTRRFSRLARTALPAQIEYVSDRPQRATDRHEARPSPPPATSRPPEEGWRTLPDGSLISADGRLALPAALPPGSPLAGHLLTIDGREYLVFRL